MNDKIIEQKIIGSWTNIFLDEIMSLNNENSFKLSPIMKKCSIAHFRALNMEKMLSPFVGKLEDFLDFIEKEWNQEIEFDKINGVITIDEKKDYCVCPLVENHVIKSSKVCICSEGFNAKMFSYILEQEVTVEVVRSWLRDKKSCIYRVKIR